ncbi:MAG: hypothetical protein ACYC3G_01490 [Minisyncoccota bacterium]
MGRLQVGQASDAYDKGMAITNAAVSTGMYFWVNGAVSRIDGSSDGSSVLALNGIGTGKVGIGTTAPGAKLDVNTTVVGQVVTAYSRITGQTNGAYGGSAVLEGYYNDTGNVEAAKLGWLSFGVVRPGAGNIGGNLMFYTKTTGGALADSPTVKMTIAPLGNVGIGTTDPSQKLEVSGGAIKATGGLIIETRTSDPASPVAGQIWLRTDL